MSKYVVFWHNANGKRVWQMFDYKEQVSGFLRDLKKQKKHAYPKNSQGT